MKAIDVAKYFLNRANNEGDLITNLKLQKLLYFAQAWYLVNFDQTLFNDEIKAWQWGPVIESVYHQFKKFRHTPIIYKNKEKIEEKFSKPDLEFLGEFYGIFINYSAHDLLQMSHNDIPWQEAYKSSSQTVSIESLKEFYMKKYEKLVAKKA